MRKRYPSDLTEAQCQRIAHIFEPGPRGRPRQVPARDLVDAVLYVLKNGCAWRALPHDFPGWQTVFSQRRRWTTEGVLPSNLQDAAGARHIIPRGKCAFPSLMRVLGDKAYRQRPLTAEMASLGVVVDGDSPPLPKGIIFKPMPLRWRVEQFFSWLCKWRRIAKNWCFKPAGFATDVAWAMLGIVLSRSVKPSC